MVEAQAEAKQLDSVTDFAQEEEMDATKAQQAASTALSAGQGRSSSVSCATAATTSAGDGDPAIANAITKEDIELIVQELDVTEEMARKTLREQAVRLGVTQRDGNGLVVAALRHLVTS